ncbi:efflux transporter outer membrane subunit [Sphingomonas nostoxanthinifaciens]|uniref:efflux transporter outer membrane subunit n=1 Tax=Sphingomonas nostoxanthinifaciens TaxID=2872652 RepID=UPI001CC209B2|nr:TolC family protein [Sphingomonas nostoxanthinifaciens]UAK24882.1 TolC family protein [Sphingomonas nostoxanthinifaciens]
MSRSLTRFAPLVALLLGGCMVGPNYRQPMPPPTATASFVDPGASAQALPSNWWRLYADPTLDALVDEALRHNIDVRVAAANLTKARYVLSEARAGRLPTTNSTAGYTRQRIGADQLGTTTGTTTTGAGATGGTGTGVGTGIGAGTGTTTGIASTASGYTFDYYNLGFNVSYELDLFGGVSRSIEAARGDYAVAAAALDAARVTVAAETARSYADVCGYAVQAASARETIDLQARTLDLTNRLNEGGRGTQRDVDQARTLYEQARAELPTIEGEQRAALAALATLTGRTPAALDPVIASCGKIPQLAAPLPAGDGRTLLARRPDVRRAERQLAADTARIGVAVADLYPTITLAGAVSLGSTRIGDIGKARSFGYSLGPLISWNFPIQSAARARVHEARATAEGSLASFDGAILTALKETEQALARLDAEQRRNAALQAAYTAAADAAKLSRYRFDYGSDSFFQLLDAERTRAQASAALATSSTALIDDQVDLFRALGGGWEEAPPVTTVSAQK